MKSTKYGLGSLRKDFPNEDACLEFIFSVRHTEECSCGGTYVRVKGRKQWQCSKCRFQIAPLAGTIFHKSDTPLQLWFHAIMVFSNAKSGMSAKALERDLEVTYKTAWRMLRLIREALGQSDDKLKGDVEIDAGFIGGKTTQAKVKENKSTVMAAVQRKGTMKAAVTPDESAEAHLAFLTLNVEPEGTRLLSDKSNRLQNAAKGYARESVDHHRKEYVRGDVHVNSVENFWSHVKRSITGTHKKVSAQHLQSYLDGFVFHANNRDNDRERFFALLNAILQPAR